MKMLIYRSIMPERGRLSEELPTEMVKLPGSTTKSRRSGL